MEQEEKLDKRLTAALRYLAVLVSLVYILAYIFVVLSRIGYPFELEWMEGASVIHIKRILEGKPLYVRPTIEFVPFFYTPFYFYISTLFSLILGLGFLPLRIVSFLSSLGSLCVIYYWVKTETRDKIFGIMAAGFFAAAFKLSGFWYDIARVDSLFLFFALAGALLVKFRSSPISFILSGVLFSLSFWTKQTALVLFAPLSIYILIYKRKFLIPFLATTITAVGGMSLLVNIITRKWYYYYVFFLPGKGDIVTENYIAFWTRDIFSPLCIGFGISVVFIVIELSGKSKERGMFYLLLFLGFIFSSWMSRLHAGGWLNVLTPGYAVILIVFVIGMSRLAEHSERNPSPFKKFIPIILYLLCLLQFSLASYNPMSQIPTQEDRKAGEYLIQTMKNIDGEIFVPYHSYLAEMAGKKSYMHVYALFDISRGDVTPIGREFLDDLIDGIRNQKFKAIFLDAPRITTRFDEFYRVDKILFGNRNAFFPVTGMKTRPEFMFVP
ncbi:glycosyltransferase family 39 protein, partial [Candidatus Sumerlaeota bacterium]|nr:glycosyltransferase family 39 protein [Candidatus Sumerlaeota bacterium]